MSEVNTFSITIIVTQEAGQPDTYRLEAPRQPLQVLYEIFRKLSDDLLIRQAVERTLQDLAKESDKLIVPGQIKL